MRPAHLVLMVGGVAALLGGLYVVLPESTSNPQPAVAMRNAADSQLEIEDIDAQGHDISPLRREISLLRGRLRSLEDLHTEFANVDRELLQLRQEMAMLRERVQAIRANDADVGTESVEGYELPMPTNAPLNEEQIEQQMDQLTEEQAYQREERMAFIDSTLQSEPMDPEWAYDVTAYVTELLGEELTSAELIHLECRATLCRIEVDHDNAMAAQRFELEFPMMVADMLPRLSLQREYADNGRVTSVAYMARKGHRLPKLDP